MTGRVSPMLSDLQAEQQQVADVQAGRDRLQREILTELKAIHALLDEQVDLTERIADVLEGRIS